MASEEGSPSRSGGPPLLIVLSGPSGVGKDSVLTRLRERGLDLYIATTATTRPQRSPADEFITVLSGEAFDRLLAEDGLLEHAEVYGYRYGVPKAQIREALARGQDVIVRVDIQGAATIKALVPDALLIFIAPPSLEELEARLRVRALDDEAALQRRLATAERELAASAGFDYTVINKRDRLEETVVRVVEIITTERRRAGRQPVTV